MQRFTGRIAIVTGAGAGIGAATARRLADEGAQVVVADIDEGRADAVAKEIRAGGGEAGAAALDVRDRDAVERVVAETVERHGRLDVMVNNAGVGSMLPMAMVDAATVDRLLDINVKGVLHGTAAAGSHMAAAGGGTIVNTASAAAVFGSPLQVLYSATKGAVLALTRAASMELAPSVRVNAVCPGGVKTTFVEAALGFPAPPELEASGAKVHPLGRMAEASEVAAAIAFLASDDASFITGIGLPVDGGMTAGALIDLG